MALLRNKAGEISEIDDDKVQAAIDLGMQPATEEETSAHEAERAKEEKYGSAGQMAITGVEGLAKGLTAGLSTPIETHLLGVKPEAIEARRETSPWISGGSEALGTVGALAYGAGEEKLGAEALERAPGAIKTLGGILSKAPPNIIGKLGRAVEEGAGGILGETLAGKVGAQAIRGAAEGALYEAGNQISESQLDPDWTAEAAVGHVGLTAALSGGIGGALGLVAEGVPRIISRAQKVTTEAQEALEGAAIRKTSAITGVPVEELESHIATEATENLSKEATMERSIRFQKAIENTETTMADASKTFNIESRAKLIDDSLEGFPVGKARTEADTFLRKAGELMDADAANPGYFENTRITDVRREMQVLSKQLENPELVAADVYKTLEETKRRLYDVAKFSGGGRAELVTAKAARDLWGSLRDSLIDENVWGEAGARVGKLNAAYSDFASARKELLSGNGQANFGSGPESNRQIATNKIKSYLNQTADMRAGTEEVGRGKLLTGYVDAAKNYSDAMADLQSRIGTKSVDHEAVMDVLKDLDKTRGEVEKVSAHQQWMKQGLEGLKNVAPGSSMLEGLKGAVTGGMGAAALHAAGAVGLAPVLGAGYAAIAAAKTVAEIRHVFGNAPEMTRAIVGLRSMANKATAGVELGTKALVTGAKIGQAVAPKLAQMLDAHEKHSMELRSLSADPQKMVDQIAKMTHGIDRHAPGTSAATQQLGIRATQFLQSKLPSPPPQTGLLATKWEPSKAEIAKYLRYRGAVEKPVSILDSARRGVLTREEVEAVSAVYPRLYQQIRTSTLSHLDPKAPMPYARRQQLGLLLGMPMDNSMTPAAISRAQATYASQQKMTAPKKGPKIEPPELKTATGAVEK